MRLPTRGRPYERRRHRPIAALAAALGVLVVLTWVVVLSTAGAGARLSCPSPTAGPEPGDVLAVDALDTVAPAPVDTVRVRVLNAGGQRGQANLVDAQLEELGFTEAAPPGNDPFHPDGEMECLGQLRFGPAGEAAAATLALVLPCTEPVRDSRTDAGVDVVVGTEFRDVDPPRAVRAVLDQLANPGDGTGADATGEASSGTTTPAPVPEDVLDAARAGAC